MKKFKELVFSGWSIAAFTVFGPVAVCVSSIVRALMYGYSVERPLMALAVIIAVVLALYYPVAKVKDIHRFDMSNEFDFTQRLIFGGFVLCFIAIFPELEQTKEFGYENHIMLWLFYGWMGFFFLFWALVILIFGFGLGRTCCD